MKIRYINKRFSEDSRTVITQANEILSEYAAQGFDLTLRQLYYQFVARDLISNNQRSYKRLGSIVADARDAGLIDWDQIVDRTRNLQSLAHWDSPVDIIDACAQQFRLDKWSTQPYHVEVWIEKEALIGVVEGVCERHDVSYFACRGYNSQSEQWRAAQRIRSREVETIILHLGDHDPSGIDMTRDIKDRFYKYGASQVRVERIALNYDQVEEHNPPPNPTKMTDTRAPDYITMFGEDSWELDALPPNVIVDLIEERILRYRDEKAWKKMIKREQTHRDNLGLVSGNWDSVVDFVWEGTE